MKMLKLFKIRLKLYLLEMNSPLDRTCQELSVDTLKGVLG